MHNRETKTRVPKTRGIFCVREAAAAASAEDDETAMCTEAANAGAGL